MPYSSPKGKDLIRKWLESIRSEIGSVLDIGVGAGYFGRLCKEILISAKIIGVEAYKPYIKQFDLDKVYDEILLGNFVDIQLYNTDLIIFGDIIEHLEKDEALLVMPIIFQKYKHIIVSIPIGKWPQGAYCGNEYERHRSTWSWQELLELFKDFPIQEKFDNIGVFIR